MSRKILVTGKNSYIGTSFIKWMAENEPDTECVGISVRGDDWKILDFSKYDCILHVAGIAHVNSSKFSKEDYYKVNTDLTVEVAKKAKKEGVSKFVFMSSIIVYNDSIIKNGIITKDTIPVSANAYGDSKIKAENGIQMLEDESFKIVIVRPPMIYGPGSKGNYPKLAKLAKKSPIFPKYNNSRSILYIDNLSSFLSMCMKNDFSGVYYPCNSQPMCTAELVSIIAKYYNHRIFLVPGLSPFIRLFKRNSLINKIFGDLYYSPGICDVENKSYEYSNLIESIKRTEGENI